MQLLTAHSDLSMLASACMWSKHIMRKWTPAISSHHMNLSTV